MDSQVLVRFDSLHVTFQRWGQTLPALIDINLEVFAGQWVKIIGHNGSGKSTLLRVLAGQQEATQGRVEILRRNPPPDGMSFASRLFYICQDPLRGTAEGLTLWENLVVADPRCRDVWGGGGRQRYAYMELLSHFGLAPRANQLLRLFSGGERQQIALLIAMLRKPEILLLDEPYSALDPVRVPQCENLIEQMNTDGCTVLQVTHDLTGLQTGCHRTVALERGRILEDRPGVSEAPTSIQTKLRG